VAGQPLQSGACHAEPGAEEPERRAAGEGRAEDADGERAVLHEVRLASRLGLLVERLLLRRSRLALLPQRLRDRGEVLHGLVLRVAVSALRGLAPGLEAEGHLL